MTVSVATTAPTQFLDVNGTSFAYRRFGTPGSTPLVFTQHFMGNLDNFDPAISDALAPGREVVLFDNAGVGRSTGAAPDTIAAMAADAARFIDGLGLRSIDLLGHSMGGEVAHGVRPHRPRPLCGLPFARSPAGVLSISSAIRWAARSPRCSASTAQTSCAVLFSWAPGALAAHRM